MSYSEVNHVLNLSFCYLIISIARIFARIYMGHRTKRISVS